MGYFFPSHSFFMRSIYCFFFICTIIYSTSRPFISYQNRLVILEIVVMFGMETQYAIESRYDVDKNVNKIYNKVKQYNTL